MKKRIKDLFIGFIIGCLLMTTTPVLANTVLQKIDVILNTVNIEINGEKLNADNILYNGTTFLPMRVVAEAVDKDIEWNQETMTANIKDKMEEVDVEKMQNIDITYEDFIAMFDLRFSIDDIQNTKVKHFVYNGNLSYNELVELIYSYGNDTLFSFGSQTIENIFGNEDYYNKDKLIICFNYDYFESMSGGQTIFQMTKNRVGNELEFWAIK